MKKTTASQTHFDFTIIRSKVYNFRGAAIWNDLGHPVLEKTCCSVMVKCVDYHWLIGHLKNSESLQLVFYWNHSVLYSNT